MWILTERSYAFLTIDSGSFCRSLHQYLILLIWNLNAKGYLPRSPNTAGVGVCGQTPNSDLKNLNWIFSRSSVLVVIPQISDLYSSIYNTSESNDLSEIGGGVCLGVLK